MVQEKRRYFRCPMQIPVNLWKDSDPEIVAACSNLSEAGIGLTNASGLKVGDKITLRLTLPETDASLKIDAQVCWRDDAGAAGLQFRDVPMPVKERLAGWLADKLEQYLQGEAVLKR
jgi:Tfp pilus assembly protein PilZ